MDLNDVPRIRDLDTQDMLDTVFRLPEMVEKILAQDFTIPSVIKTEKFEVSYVGRPTQIIICGMGGSAVSGDYIQTIFPIKIPVIVVRNYNLPAFADQDSLVCLVSYSGNTEETLSCLLSALQRGCRVVGISSGGFLSRFFKDHDLPLFEIPAGYQPRAAFPLIFFPLVKILQSLDLVNLRKSVIDETLYILRDIRDKCRPEIQLSENRAKLTAQSLFQKIPVIWAPYACITNRVKCQINENCKRLAIAEELPELNHNHVVGWEGYEAENHSFLILGIRFPSEHPNVHLRFEITKEIVRKKSKLLEIHARGAHLFCQLVSVTYFFDYITIYLAMLNSKDPSTVESIDFLKHQLEVRGRTQSRIFEALDQFSTQ